MRVVFSPYRQDREFDQVWNSLAPALRPALPGEVVRWYPEDSSWHARHPSSPWSAQAKGQKLTRPAALGAKPSDFFLFSTSALQFVHCVNERKILSKK